MMLESPEPLGGMDHAQMAAHSLDLWLQSEDLPDPNNRITITALGEIELNYLENNMEAHRRLKAKLYGLLSDIGCHERLIPVDYYLDTVGKSMAS